MRYIINGVFLLNLLVPALLAEDIVNRCNMATFQQIIEKENSFAKVVVVLSYPGVKISHELFKKRDCK